MTAGDAASIFAARGIGTSSAAWSERSQPLSALSKEPSRSDKTILQSSFPTSSSKGFTLLELVVVLALATALIAIVPPLITAAIPSVELKSSSRRIAAGLRLAREEAIRTGRHVAFTLDLERRMYRIDGDFRQIDLPDGLDLKLTAAESEMQGEQVGAIRFFPDGSSTGGRVVVALEDNGWQVGVEWLTGRIRLAPWEGGE